MTRPSEEQNAEWRRLYIAYLHNFHQSYHALHARHVADEFPAVLDALAAEQSESDGLKLRIENMGLTFARSPLRQRRDGEWFAEVPVDAFLKAMESWPSNDQ